LKKQFAEIILILTLLVSCKRVSENIETANREEIITIHDTVSFEQPVEATVLEKNFVDAGLVDIKQIDSTIVVDLKYSTTNNFIGIDVYGDFAKCYLLPEVAQKLSVAQKLLHDKYPFYHLLIFDGARPLAVQKIMWDTLKIPLNQKTKFLSNPDVGSLHNYGAAVDLSIINERGVELNMGTEYDFIGELAHPVLEQMFLAKGLLSIRQIENRKLLREVMQKAGFFPIQSEWWHFNSCSRNEAARKFRILE